nr:MAG TPA: helix-turn-helix domain protein [Caudoviricetes sp.]
MGFYEKYLCLCNSINKSPSAVALELKIGKPSVTRWKNGATPRDATVLKIADYFGVTVSELMAGVGEQENAPATEGEGVSAERKALLDIVSSLTDEQCRKLLVLVQGAKTVL